MTFCLLLILAGFGASLAMVVLSAQRVDGLVDGTCNVTNIVPAQCESGDQVFSCDQLTLTTEICGRNVTTLTKDAQGHGYQIGQSISCRLNLAQCLIITAEDEMSMALSIFLMSVFIFILGSTVAAVIWHCRRRNEIGFTYSHAE